MQQQELFSREDEHLDYFGGMYEPPDVDAAHAAWGASCGPCSLAAIAGRSVDSLRSHLAGFEGRGWMNATHMLAACRSIGLVARLVNEGPWFNAPAALLRIQFGGPWLKPGVPPVVAFKYTHWIAARHTAAYDVNVGFWISEKDWGYRIAPQIAATMRRADGTWYVRDAVVIDEGAN